MAEAREIEKTAPTRICLLSPFALSMEAAEILQKLHGDNIEFKHIGHDLADLGKADALALLTYYPPTFLYLDCPPHRVNLPVSNKISGVRVRVFFREGNKVNSPIMGVFECSQGFWQVWPKEV